MVVLVTGGARSGKSSFAEKYAAYLGTEGIYVATTEIIDKEMEQRVKQHTDRRASSSFTWTTIEEPYQLAEQIRRMNESNQKDQIVLVDCLTIWLSNWLLSLEGNHTIEKVMEKIIDLIDTLTSFEGHILLVTNEVGNGIVPEYPLGRIYRDLAGVMNQQVAEISQQVFMVTAGIAVELKSNEFKFGK